MNSLDLLIVILIGLSALLGLWRGFLLELLFSIPWILAIVAALMIGPRMVMALSAAPHGSALSPVITGLLKDTILSQVVCFLIIFLVVYLITRIIVAFASIPVRSVGHFNASNHLLGFFFGVIRGTLLGLLVLSVLQSAGLNEASWWKKSVLAPYAFSGFDEAQVQQAIHQRPWLDHWVDRLKK